jgi:hypothetical protein
MAWSPRTGGLAGLFAAGLIALSALLDVTGPVEVYRAVALVAFLAVIGAVAGIHAAHRGRPRYGWVGTVAAAVTSTGYAVVAGVIAIDMVRDADGLLGVRTAGAVLVLAGSAVLGVVVMVARLLPWWCGVLLVVAFPLGDLADDVFPTAENLLLALLWASVGTALLSRAAHPARTTGQAPGGAITQRSTLTG